MRFDRFKPDAAPDQNTGRDLGKLVALRHRQRHPLVAGLSQPPSASDRQPAIKPIDLWRAIGNAGG